ncbi:DUF1800 domain-containing protein [Flammeovirgaceae bacterium SG7u.111]|nr:DUF1800 domain-containing protein [Flammeovirgaceae bacterium SG7u.132]WPO36193.1 DUF1800 domain-containing protein [Flammeovirgaceae bacterium SG7u.111]
MKLNQQQIQHLFLRAGFGINYDLLQKYDGLEAEVLVEKLFEKSAQSTYLDLAEKEAFRPPMNGDPGAKKVFQKKSREMVIKLNVAWLKSMATSEGSLREKMTFFWQGHFASSAKNPYLVQQQHNLIKKHALGSFGDLLKAVSKDAVMLQYLNNQQNKKNAPNENFAREVMELFTLGRGNYTENDIKEAARAFTGWGFNKEGEFFFRKRIHDYGEKTVLGKTGNFDGDEVLDILLEQKQTAKYLTGKIYAFFVNDQVDETKVEKLADSFYASGYDISALLKEVFTSNWFYDPKNIGSKIKSPVELLVGNMQYFYMDFGNEKALVGIQRMLGQILFKPPNVAGWPNGEEWIDASTLMFRLKLTEASLAASLVGGNEELWDKKAGKGWGNRLKKMHVSSDLEAFQRQFGTIPAKDLIDRLCAYFIQLPLSDEKKKLVGVRGDLPEEERLLRTVAKISKLPEFQMC